jgi:hypothetical protein
MVGRLKINLAAMIIQSFVIISLPFINNLLNTAEESDIFRADIFGTQQVKVTRHTWHWS